MGNHFQVSIAFFECPAIQNALIHYDVASNKKSDYLRLEILSWQFGLYNTTPNITVL